ncbi:MAG: cupin domain-containing protein [Sedimenticola sp.]|nr:cupin domain-containing protein [Sedimenticola sp.]
MKQPKQEITGYRTKDGSTIRELMHPDHHPVKNQSLAEATIEPGSTTRLHRHLETEEIYHVTAGEGVMILGQERFSVAPGDSIPIPPGTAHAIHNSGDRVLRILCCCAPAYRHEDTELL